MKTKDVVNNLRLRCNLSNKKCTTTLPGAAASSVSVELELLVVVVVEVCSEMESDMDTSGLGEMASSTCMGSAGATPVVSSALLLSVASVLGEPGDPRPLAMDEDVESASRNSTSTSTPSEGKVDGKSRSHCGKRMRRRIGRTSERG